MIDIRALTEEGAKLYGVALLMDDQGCVSYIEERALFVTEAAACASCFFWNGARCEA